MSFRGNKVDTKILYGVILIGILSLGYFLFFDNTYKFTENRPIRILIVNSYSFVHPFAEGQNVGFLEGLNESGLNYDLKTFFMYTKINTSEEWKEQKGKEARELINSWDPDLVYLTDDNAQEYVGRYYVDADFPMIFSGVNGEAEDYGYDEAKNVAGVLERDPYIPALKVFHEIFPTSKRIVVIKGDDSSGRIVAEWMKEESKKYLDLDVIGFYLTDSFEKYKEYILEYQNETDGFFLGGFSAFKDKDGELVSREELVKWTVENSDVPEIVVVKEAVQDGAFFGLSNAPVEYGRVAWELAEKILIEGEEPSDLNFEVEVEGEQSLNFARARMLGLRKENIANQILINSEVYDEFSWEE